MNISLKTQDETRNKSLIKDYNYFNFFSIFI